VTSEATYRLSPGPLGVYVKSRRVESQGEETLTPFICERQAGDLSEISEAATSRSISGRGHSGYPRRFPLHGL
jgi:hypothetical protein